jgi:hypothetical protein
MFERGHAQAAMRTRVQCGTKRCPALADLCGGQKGHGPPNLIKICTIVFSKYHFLPYKSKISANWPPQLLFNLVLPLLHLWSRSATGARGAGQQKRSPRRVRGCGVRVVNVSRGIKYDDAQVDSSNNKPEPSSPSVALRPTTESCPTK